MRTEICTCYVPYRMICALICIGSYNLASYHHILYLASNLFEWCFLHPCYVLSILLCRRCAYGGEDEYYIKVRETGNLQQEKIKCEMAVEQTQDSPFKIKAMWHQLFLSQPASKLHSSHLTGWWTSWAGRCGSEPYWWDGCTYCCCWGCGRCCYQPGGFKHVQTYLVTQSNFLD